MTAEGMSLEGHKTQLIIVVFSLENCWDGFRQPLELVNMAFLIFFFLVENHSNSVSG